MHGCANGGITPDHGEPLVELVVESGIQEASLALTAMLENHA